jgi:hypothetical protein
VAVAKKKPSCDDTLKKNRTRDGATHGPVLAATSGKYWARGIDLLPLYWSAAQGNLTSCLNFDFAILNLFEPSAP